jgi:intracellular multiplication protein IcmK
MDSKDNRIALLAVISFFLLPQLSWAQEMPSGTLLPQSADAAQFQNWLTNNQAAPAPNSVQGPTTPPPIAPQDQTAPVPASSQAPTTPPPLSSPGQAPTSSQAPTTPPPIATQPGQQFDGVKQRLVKRKIKLQPNTPDSPTVLSPPLTYRQSQEIMLNSTPPSAPPSEESNTAFNAMMQQNMPLTPQQVVRLRQLIDSSQRAATIPATVPPKPVSSTLIMNLAPGATPPAIRLAQGYVSTLVFVDSTGAPWPIASYDIGDPKMATPQWDGKSNVMLIQAMSPYGDGNLVIRLAGLPTPITLEMVSGQRVVDYRTDIHVPGIGPESKDLPIGTPLPNSANQLLLSVLDGIAPPGSKQLIVAGGGSDCQAWLLGDKMYLRSRMTVLSPGWIGKMTSPDGMYAYEMQRTSSVLVSQYGNPVELKIEGF